MRWSRPILLILLFALASTAHAQKRGDFVETHSAETQEWLASRPFDCPENAYGAACDSFHVLAKSGDQNFLTIFSVLTIPTEKAATGAWVIFDNDSDMFWTLSLMTYQPQESETVKVVFVFAHYSKGICNVTWIGEADEVNGGVSYQAKSKDFSLHMSGSEISIEEAYKNTDRAIAHHQIKIDQSTRHMTSSWAVAGRSKTDVVEGRAVYLDQKESVFAEGTVDSF
jgi:hypothetical protein